MKLPYAALEYSEDHKMVNRVELRFTDQPRVLTGTEAHFFACAITQFNWYDYSATDDDFRAFEKLSLARIDKV